MDAAAGRSVSADLGAAAAPEERKQVDWGGEGGEKAAGPITNAECLTPRASEPRALSAFRVTTDLAGAQAPLSQEAVAQCEEDQGPS